MVFLILECYPLTFQIFQVYLKVVAVAFICYLQFYLLRHHDGEGHEPQEPKSPFNLVATLHRNEDGVVTLSKEEEERLQKSFYLGDTKSRDDLVEMNQGQPKSRHVSMLSDDEEDTTWIDLSTIGSIFDHEGSSIFLRFGTLSMCISSTSVQVFHLTICSLE